MNLAPFQIEGAVYLASSSRAYLADMQGLGKTAQVLAALEILQSQQTAPLRVIVQCPAMARNVWPEQRELWTPGSRVLMRVFSYDELAASLAKRVSVRRSLPDVMVFDEAHYLKNETSRRTRMNFARKGGLARAAVRVWFLSGTPAPKHPGELFSILQFGWSDALASADIFGSSAWMNHTCKWWNSPYGPRPTAVRPDRIDWLKTFLWTRCKWLRRTDVNAGVQWPDIIWQRANVPAIPSGVLADIADAETRDAAERAARAGTVDDNVTRMRNLIGPYKANKVMSVLIREHREQEWEFPLVVFAYYHDTLDVIERRFRERGVSVVRVDGSSSDLRRRMAVEAFQAGRVDVFLGQIKACATAITLTRAHRCEMVEPLWSYGDNDQAARRLLRHGQTQRVHVRMWEIDKMGVDLAVYARHKAEERMVSHVVGE